MKQERKTYTPEFKREAVAMATQQGHGYTEAARILKINPTMLRRWEKEQRANGDQAFPGKGHQVPALEEIARLKRALTDIELLKKQRRTTAGMPELEQRRSSCRLRQGNTVKYAFIRDNKAHYPVRQLCEVLDVQPGSYYAWCRRSVSQRAQANIQLDVHIQAVFAEHQRRYGSPRITKELHEQGKKCSENRVAARMQLLGLQAKGKRKYKATTHSNHTLPVVPNLLEQNFEAPSPNQKWVSDITYVWTDEGWLYLAVVPDVYSRLVVGYALSARIDWALVIAALRRALFRRHFPPGVIVHSDRGSQYCSEDYQALLSEHGLICSMSKRGDCYDNAAMESWNHSYKVETIHGERFATRWQAEKITTDYIDRYYNVKRRHSTLGLRSPQDYELTNVA
ncbi:MAG: IS3 family transposase [Gammaproteobacteria bacterium]|nr:IS3 family transposase [Gammaproteobacteria bacterium]